VGEAEEQGDVEMRLVDAAPLRRSIRPLDTAAGAPTEDADTAAGVAEVILAGEIELRKREERLRDGIPVSFVVSRELEALAGGQHVPFELG
jgi:LDH2 family malate/lactate/ureidoglycolate dehydrogenase